MNYFWMFAEFLFCLTDTVIFFYYCSKLLEKKESADKYHYVCAGALITVITFFITQINVYSNWKTLLSVLMLFICIRFISKDILRKQILFLIIFVAVSICSEIVSTALVIISRNSESWSAVLNQSLDRIISFAVSRIIILLFIMFIGYFKASGESLLRMPHWIVFIVSFTIVLILAILLLNSGHSSKAFSNNIFLVSVLALLFIYFCNLYLFNQMGKYIKKASENEFIQYQDRLIEKYIIQKNDSDKMIKMLSHNLKHNLLLWKRLAENQGYAEILDGISEYEQLYEKNQITDVGNETANAIIYPKISEARKNNIRFNIRGAFSGDIQISPVDLCSLLGNVLDNAIEAAKEIKDDGKREISLDINRDGKFLFIEVSNTYETEPVVKNNVLVTKNKNKINHGIGMTSINYVAEKYQGAVDYVFKDRVFIINIMLRAYEG